MQIAISGNIGAGKTELTKLLARHYGYRAIFAPNLQSMGLMTTRDLTTYTNLFETTYALLPKPDLLIYVRGDVTTLIRHIQKRGRELESSIRLDYLTNLNNRYEQWAEQYEGKMLVVDTDVLDFVERREDLGHIIEKIDAEFNSLFAAQGEEERK